MEKSDLYTKLYTISTTFFAHISWNGRGLLGTNVLWTSDKNENAEQKEEIFIDRQNVKNK